MTVQRTTLQFLAAVATLTAGINAHAGTLLIDVTAGGAVTGVPNDNDWPAGEPPAAAMDDNYYSKFLHRKPLGAGVIVAATNTTTPVTEMILATANDSATRDPTSYVLEGSADGISWSPISSGALALPAGRNTAITTPAVNHQRLTFANTTAYAQYRVTFPTNGGDGLFQIGEISLLGTTDPGADIFDLQSYTATISGGSTPPSGAEDPQFAIDNNPASKYLNFGKAGAGMFLTTTGSASLVTGISLVHAGDASARDVTGFTLRGSNDGITYTDIVTNQPFANGMGLFEGTTLGFANSTAYRDYEFIVTSLRNDGAANSFQFSEIQLHGALVPEPSAGLLALLAAPFILRRRRK